MHEWYFVMLIPTHIIKLSFMWSRPVKKYNRVDEYLLGGGEKLGLAANHPGRVGAPTPGAHLGASPGAR